MGIPMSTHPRLVVLIEHILHTLSSEERLEVERHLALPCLRCQTIVSRFEQVWEILRAPKIVSQAPPLPVLQRMVSVFQMERFSWSQRISAVLQFDSFRQLSLSPVRGVTQARQMLFSASGVDIDLRVTPEDGAVSVRGQVLGANDVDRQGWQEAILVCLQQAGEVIACTRTDEWGQFLFSYVPTGTYDLLVSYRQTQIAVENLLLGYGE